MRKVVAKISGLVVMIVATLALVLAGVSQTATAHAQTYGNRYMNNRDYRSIGQGRYVHHRKVFHRPKVVIITDRHFFDRHGVIRRHPVFRRHLPSHILSRRVIIVDRSNPGDFIVVRNTRTGAFSVNTVRVDVDRDFFLSLRNRIDIDNDIDIDVNTGNNTASFNTGNAIINTGDVDISID